MSYDYETTRGSLYRSRHGAILGVCRGLAEYVNFSVFWTRVIALACLVFTGFWPVLGLYLLAALLMKPEPVHPFLSEEDREFYDTYAASRSSALQRLKRTYDHLDRRIRRMENVVTSRDYDWERRLNS
ncbi:MAG TPA: envelope stress response membrane protein PspC [Candidatus Hydrogenedentes bacterium]|nr:envelope stress response membrane protein PspC [Candidatus Hydrogenedentota bacterium]HPG69068.1 envelope stress response membrane protein PspC [Candidatus Hydrogenedentota bacterium]